MSRIDGRAQNARADLRPAARAEQHQDGARYRTTPALITASGLGGQTVAIVPPDGLNQIPDGGAAYWLGGLYISDNAGIVLEQWSPTPQVEGSPTTTSLGLTNRSARVVTVSAITITTGRDAPGMPVFTITATFPLTVQPGTFTWVPTGFRVPSAGPITGTISVTCDDPTVAQFSLPVATSANPLGPHGQLQVSPAALDAGPVRVGQPFGTNVTLTNTGARVLGVADLRVIDGTPPGQFAIPLSLPTQLAPGGTSTVYVSGTATERGRLSATLSIDVQGSTSTTQPFRHHVDVPLTATAKAPVVFLAGSALPPVLPGRLRPPLRPRDLPGFNRLSVELQQLEFGAVAPGILTARTFWVRNVGDLPLAISGVSTTNQSVFGFGNLSMLPATLAPGGEVGIEANFLASAIAGMPAAAELRVHTDDPLRPVAALGVTGRAAGPHVTLEPPEVLDLGAGTAPTGVLTITSDGTDPVTLRKVDVADLDFALSGLPALPASLAPGTSLGLTVSCHSAVPGLHTTRLTLMNDGSPNGRAQVDVQAQT